MIMFDMLTKRLSYVPGPWAIGELVEGHIGVIFAWGLFLDGSFLPGSFTYAFATVQVRCSEMNHRRSSYHQTMTTLGEQLNFFSYN